MPSRAARKAGPRPWDAPGFRFYTADMQAWLQGYVPTIWLGFVKGNVGIEASIRSSELRLANVGGWGGGTIGGMKSTGNVAKAAINFGSRRGGG